MDSPDRRARIETWSLLVVVFLSGAALMGLEMVGARVLWNDFGSSVFVWGSILSVFMGALAGGYYVGGRLADRRPQLEWLGGLVGLAGIAILGLTRLAAPICDAIDALDLGLRAGPLFAAAALYFVPSFLLGGVSPFAVRLQARNVSSMGNVAGTLYALSTIGSLAGTLLTTFVLIPTFGTSRILYMVGCTLLGVALLTVVTRLWVGGLGRVERAGATGALGIALLAGYGFGPSDWPLTFASHPLLALDQGTSVYEFLAAPETESAYHSIAVVGSFNPAVVHESDPTKLATAGMAQDPNAKLELRFNNLVQSSTLVNQPSHPPGTTYTRLVHLPMALHPEAKKILILGLGGGSVPRELTSIYPGTQVDVVEIDPAVVDAAARYFGHHDDDAIQTYTTDGRQFIRRGLGRFPTYDIVFLDAYSGGGQIPGHLVTREFIEQCKARLAPDGLLMSNIISAIEGDGSRFFHAEYKTISQVFPTLYVFPSFTGDPERVRTLIVIASRAPSALDTGTIASRAQALLDTHPILRERTKNPRGPGDLVTFAMNRFVPRDAPEAPILTDDFAPVETMHFWH